MLKAIDNLLIFMQRHQLARTNHTTYDCARWIYENNPVRTCEWIEIMAESKTDRRIVVWHDMVETTVEAVSLNA